MTALLYRGGGFRPDLPQRDIDAAELQAMADERKTSVALIVEAARSSGLYTIVVEPDDAPAEIAEPKSLDEMSKDELRAACKDIGVSQAGSKDEMIARIRAKLDEAPEINAEDVPE
jgi:hypothetical protein